MNYLEWLIAKEGNLDEARKMGQRTLYTAQRTRAEMVMNALKAHYGDRVSFGGIAHEGGKVGLAFSKDGKERTAFNNPKRAEGEWNDWEASQKARGGTFVPSSKKEAGRIYNWSNFGKANDTSLPQGMTAREANMHTRAALDHRNKQGGNNGGWDIYSKGKK